LVSETTRYTRLRVLLLIACGGMVLAAVWFAALTLIRSEYQDAIKRGNSNASYLANTVADHAEWVLKNIDQTLSLIAYSAGLDTETLDLPVLMASAVAERDVILQLAFYGPDGKLAQKARPLQSTPNDLSANPIFKAVRSGTGETMAVGNPFQNTVTDEFALMVGRRVSRANAGFGGVVIAFVNPAELIRIHAVFDPSFLDEIGLIGNDGVLRARATSDPTGPFDPITALADLDRNSLAARERLWHATHAPQDTFLARLADYPFTVFVGFNNDAVIRTALAARENYLYFAGLLTVVIIGTLAVMLRQFGARGRLKPHA
jgi:hypothetical protein